MSATMGNQTMQTQFERRSRSNLPYSKKHTATRSEVSDIFGEATTMATASPTFRHALSVNGSDRQNAQDISQIQEVTEVSLPKNAITNNYRKTRLLHKGCHKLLRLVDKHQVDIEQSIKDKNRMSQRLGTNMDRIKLSIMSNRANTIYTPNLAKTLDEPFTSGFSTHKNAYLKHDLHRTAPRNNNSGAPPSFPSMAVERNQVTSSELN